MNRPCIRMELDDGTNTWITVYPVRQLDHVGVEYTAGEAFVGFLRSLTRESDAVDAHMEPFRDGP